MSHNTSEKIVAVANLDARDTEIAGKRYRRIQFTDRAAWSDFRSSGFGASEAAALFDAHPYQTRAATILKKLGVVDAQDGDENFRVRRLLEPGLLANYEAVTKRAALRRDAFVMQRLDLPFLFASPDAETIEATPRLVELKTASCEPERWEEGGVPLMYQFQVQAQMLCSGIGVTDIATLFTGSGKYAFRVFEIRADTELQDLLIERGKAAWDLVVALRRGENVALPDAGPADGSLLARLRAPLPETVMQLSEADLLLAQRWRSRKAEAASYRKIADGLEELVKGDCNAIVSRMAGAGVATFEGSDLRLVAKARTRKSFVMPESAWVEVKEVEEKEKRDE